MRSIIRSLSLLVLITGLQACQQAEAEQPSLRHCSGEDPLADLPWLPELINSLSDTACLHNIHQYSYRGGTVFVLRCGIESLCYCLAPTVLDCEGEVVLSLDGVDGPTEAEFLQDAQDEHLIWKSE